MTLHQDDCIERMAQTPEASIDAIVTDPPYGLRFMGRSWDTLGRNAGEQSARLAYWTPGVS